MNKNNKSNSQTKQSIQVQQKKKSPNKKPKIKFNNIQTDYQPKIKIFKHKFLKTDDDLKKIKQRIQLEKQQEKVVSKALQCLKKGQVINIDWKTKTNFRKSQNNLKLPRLQTQPHQFVKQNWNTPNNHRSNNFSKVFQNLSSKSVKLKSIQQKYSKLTDLLVPRDPSAKLYNKRYFSQQKPQQISKQSIKISNKNSIRINSQIEGKSQDFNVQLQKSNLVQSDVSFKLQKVRSLTGDISKQIEKLNSSTQSNKILSQKDKQLKSNSSLNNKNQASVKVQSIKSQQKLESQRKISGRDPLAYDLLQDPAMYLLISKSRDKLIDFKQRLSMEKMSHVQKLKHTQDKRKQQQSINLYEAQMNKILEKQIDNQKQIDQRQSILKKLQSKRKQLENIRNQKMSKVFKQSQKYLKSASKQKQLKESQIKSRTTVFKNINECDQVKSQYEERYGQRSQNTFDLKSSKIRQRKRQSLVNVQQRLLKKVKLSFLKQDLIQKFEQIRSYQKSPKSSNS